MFEPFGLKINISIRLVLMDYIMGQSEGRYAGRVEDAVWLCHKSNCNGIS